MRINLVYVVRALQISFFEILAWILGWIDAILSRTVGVACKEINW